VAWLTLDSMDNDLDRLYRYIIAALQTLEANIGDESLDYFLSTKTGGTELGITLLINEIAASPKEMILVLDDFQALETQPMINSTDYFLKHLPRNFHIVIASRNEPGLDLAFLRAKNRVVALDADDLRFTAAEIGQFFQQTMGLQLSAEIIRNVEQRTDGWVTALQMAALSLQHQANPNSLLTNLEGDSHYLVDFLAEEVLDRQPEDVRQFLLRSSVLDTLSGPLCEAVVNPDAQPGYGMVMLDRLEHARLFISALDERHEVFRYHTLFADFLRHIHAEINPTEIPVLKKRAAVWFEQHANLDGAIQYALASGDMEWTADLIQRNIEIIIGTGELFSLTHWIGQLPDAVIHNRPALGLTYAWGLIAAYRLDLAHYWMDDVRDRLSELDRRSGTGAGDGSESGSQEGKWGLWNVRGGLAICQSTLAMLNGDVEQAAQFTQQATRYLQESNPFIQSLVALDDSLYYILSGDPVKAIYSLRNTVRIARQANNLMVMTIAACQLADMQSLQGQLDQAWVTLQKAQYIALKPDGKPIPLAGLVDIGLGEILFERGSLDEAHIYLERGFQTAQPLWSIISVDGMVSLARLRQAEGNISGSKAIIDEAARIALGTESSQWDDQLVCTIATRMALQRGDLVEAEQWWIKGRLPDISGTITLESYPYHIFEFIQLTQARFLVVRGMNTCHAGDLQHAAAMLNSLHLEAVRLERVTSQIEILVLLALVQYAQKDDRAVGTLMQALALGEPQGFKRIFLDEGGYLAPLLQHCQAARPESGSYLPSAGYITNLANEIQKRSQTGPAGAYLPAQINEPVLLSPEEGPPAILSTRELEVLQLIAEGKSNQEISAQLYLALNTVKRHAYNIYAKLGVKKRTQAVSTARKLGLIP
jgi:LuxR family maltose regulon positive regulatory protein